MKTEIRIKLLWILLVVALLSGCTQPSSDDIGLEAYEQVTYLGRPVTLELRGIDAGQSVLWRAEAGTIIQLSETQVEWSPPEKTGDYTVYAFVHNPRGDSMVCEAVLSVTDSIAVPTNTLVEFILLQDIPYGDLALGQRFPLLIKGDVTYDGFTLFADSTYGVLEVTFAENYSSDANRVALGLAIRDVQISDGRLINLSSEHGVSFGFGTEETIDAYNPATMFINDDICYLLSGEKDMSLPKGTKVFGITNREVDVTVSPYGIGRHPEASRAPVLALPYVGLEVISYSEVYHLFYSEGVKVTEVFPDSPALNGELIVGDRIVAVESSRGIRVIKDARDFAAAIRPSFPGEILVFHVENLYNEKRVPIEIGVEYSVMY